MSITDYPDGSTNANALVLTEGSTQLQVTSGTATQSGIISETGGSFGLEKIGSGMLTFTGSNTYTGTTTISAGTLRLGDGTNGHDGNISNTVADNGSLIFDRSSAFVFRYGGAISGAGSVIQAGFIVTLTGTNTYTGGTTINSGSTLEVGSGGSSGSIIGDVVDNGTLALARSDSITFSGNISGSGQVTLPFQGTVILTGNNSYTGGTVLTQQAVLEIGNGGTTGSLVGNINTGGLNAVVAFNRSDSTSFAGIISGPGLVAVWKGTVNLTGTNTYTGGTLLTGGTLVVSSDANLGASSGSLQLSGGGNAIEVGTLRFSASFNLASTRTITIGQAVATIDTNGFNTTISQGIKNGTGGLVKAGAGTLVLGGQNTYAGGTTVNAGTLQLGAGGSLASTGAVTVNSGTFDVNGQAVSIGKLSGTGGSIALGSGSLTTAFVGTSTLASTIGGSGSLTTQASGTLILTGANIYAGGTTLNGGTLQVGNGGTIGSIVGNVGGFGILSFNRSDSLTFGGAISGNMIVSQDGAGTTILTGPNTYAFGTVVNAGTLRLSTGGTLGSGAELTVNGGTLDLNNIDLTVGAAVGLGGFITLGSANITVTSNVGSPLASVISGTGSVTVSAGLLRLTGENTYTGGTNITGTGGLDIGYGSTSGSIVGDITDNSVLGFNHSNTFTYGGVVSGSGRLLNLGSGTLILTGTNTYTGGTETGNALIQIGNGGTTGWISGDVVANASGIAINRSDDVIFNGAISGSNVTQMGSGSLTLTGANTFSNVARVLQGSLVIAATSSLSSNLTVQISGTSKFITEISATLRDLEVSSGTTLVAAATGQTLSFNTLSVGTGSTLTFGSAAKAGTININTSTPGISSTSSIIVAGGVLRDATATPNASGGGGGSVAALFAAQFTVDAGATVDFNDHSVRLNTNPALGANLAGAGQVILGSNASTEMRLRATNFSGAISGAGTVTFLSNVNSHILTGSNTYTGGTTINSGATLLVDGTIASSAVTVASGATLGGSGTVGTTSIQAGGTLAPGDGIGTLQVNGNLTLASGATYAEEASSANADEITVTGNANIAGNLTADFAGSSSGHQSFTILHSTGTLSGAFATISVTGLPAGLTAVLTYGAHDVTLTTDHAPAAATANIIAGQGQSLALSSLLSVSDADGDTMTRYQLWDSTRDPNSGHFVVNGVAQAAGTVIDVTATQLTQTFFVAGSVGDGLQIRAFDGYAWSAADNASWSPFTVSIRSNSPPSLSTTTQRLAAGQSLSLSSLVTVIDADGDAITRYQLWDSTRDPNSGHWVINGQAQAAGTVIDITAAQLGQTSFVAGTVNDGLQIRAFDGIAWSAPDTGSWAPFTIGPLVNNAPVVQTSNRTIARGVTTALSGLITVSDADSDAMTEYQLWDGSRDPNSGHFVVNGQVQAAGTVIDITAAQLAQTSFVTGSLGDSLQIRAFDGISWSTADTASWSPFTVSVPDAAPVVSTNNVTKSHLQSYALSSLFSVTDADGDAMTRYQLWDSTHDLNSGHFVINGQAQPAGTVIDITAAQLAQTSFFTGTVGDNLQIRAFDGIAWSALDTASWAPFAVNIPTNSAPVVSTGTVNAMHGRTLALSSLFSVTDADGDSMTRYQLWDSTRDPLSGHFMVNGVAQAAGTVIDITAAQLNQTSFVTGQVGDGLQIRAFDGIDWSDADNAPWKPFTVAVTPYTNPSLSTQDVSATAGQSLALSGLINVSDPDGDSMTNYELWDSNRNPNSGNWVVNGQLQAAGTVIDITAAQLAQTSFLTGAAGMIDSVQVRAFDGINWTAVDNAAWALFHVTAT